MKLLKNRMVLGTLCIAISLVICFLITPMFNKSISHKTKIVRVTKVIEAGEQIKKDMIETVEVGSYNLPDSVLRSEEEAIGKYASGKLEPGDYILAGKTEVEPAAENAYLYRLNGEKQAISVSLKSFASGLSGKLQSGDIVSVIAPDYRNMGETVIPDELQYIEVIAVTAGSGDDANTGQKKEDQEDEEKELPSTVTLLGSPIQCRILAEMEADGKLHVALVYRGDPEQARQFLAAQATELIECLRNITPYVIIDCSSYITNDILSAIALMESDSVLRLVNCDLKSISYLSSQLPLLKDHEWDADKQYKVANNVKTYEASGYVEQVLGNVAFQIPYSSEVEQQGLEGDLLKDLSLKESRKYRKEIEKIVEEVFGC